MYGTVAKVQDDGVRIFIEYDDGDSGWADYPEEGLEMIEERFGKNAWNYIPDIDGLDNLLDNLNERGQREKFLKVRVPPSPSGVTRVCLHAWSPFFCTCVGPVFVYMCGVQFCVHVRGPALVTCVGRRFFHTRPPVQPYKINFMVS